MAAISVRGLSKNFRVRRPQPGARPMARLFGARPVIELPAVSDISFAIAPGERVAFIGPNGAGKSTTLKMLTGILRPSAGEAEVAGCVPWRQRRRLARRIGIVFGQRSQLWYSLPVRSSFELLRRIYDVERPAHQARLARLAATFDIGELLDRPVSELSLGQRMRCEIAAALLHAPAIAAARRADHRARRHGQGGAARPSERALAGGGHDGAADLPRHRRYRDASATG